LRELSVDFNIRGEMNVIQASLGEGSERFSPDICDSAIDVTMNSSPFTTIFFIGPCWQHA